MKTPEQVRRIEELTACKTALDIIERAYLVLGRHAGLAVPSYHPAYRACIELYETIDRASVQVTLALEESKHAA